MIELLIALGGPASLQSPGPVGVVVVSLDDATQGQIRYGRSTVAAVGGQYGSLTFVPPPLGEAAFRDCLDRDLERAETCARFYIGHNQARATRPPIVVVLLSDADADHRFRNSQLEVSCVGVGDGATDPGQQTIRLWPDAARVRGMNDQIADQNAMTGCIAAAAAESGR